MVEEQRRESGYPIDPAIFHREIYRFISVFSGSKAIAEYSARNGGSRLPNLLQMFERAEASRLLISIAVIARNVWEFSPTAPHVSGYGGHTVGDLIPDLDGNRNESSPLDFREACNKVIHCDGMNFDIHRVAPGEGFPYLEPKVHLFGMKGKRHWKASINVYAFAECAYDYT